MPPALPEMPEIEGAMNTTVEMLPTSGVTESMKSWLMIDSGWV